MEYRRLGASGLKVSPICLGMMMFGERTDRRTAARIVGPRTFEQWREYLGALQHGFDAEDEAFIDGLVPAGHASTPGCTDPRFPVTGRVPLE